jgi:hypothetical protein
MERILIKLLIAAAEAAVAIVAAELSKELTRIVVDD